MSKPLTLRERLRSGGNTRLGETRMRGVP